MIPPLLPMPLPAYAPSGSLTVYFPASASTHSMGTGASVVITVTYNYPGEPTDYIDMFVNNGTYDVQWGPFFPASRDVYSNTATYSSTSIGWLGAGTYLFRAAAQRVSTGTFDVASNVITLTVS